MGKLSTEIQTELMTTRFVVSVPMWENDVMADS